MKLNTTALVKNTATGAFKTSKPGWFHATFDGNLNNETLTLEASFDGLTWKDFQSAGVAQTYTNNSADVINTVNYFLPGGLYFRFLASNGAGTLSLVFVHVDGDNILLVPAAG